jgi:hypothetical protein
MSYDACEGCGREFLSAEPWEFKGLKYMTPDELDRWQNEEIRFKSEHPNCRAGAWTFQGSLTKHCFNCCPPAPFGKLVRRPPFPEVLLELESRLGPNPPEALARMAEAQQKLFGKKI